MTQVVRGKYLRVREYLLATFMILAAVYWSILQISDDYVIDETAFPFAAKGVSETGRPYFYNGNTRPNDLGIWHPPLYVYLLGVWIKVLGFGHFQVRMFGVLCTVITCLLIYKTIRLFPQTSGFTATLGMAFYATHYFVIQSSLIPDIDGTLQPVAITMSIYFVAKILTSPDQPAFKSHLMVTIGLGVCFSSKFTTPLLLVLPIGLTYLYKTKSFLKTISFTLLQLIFGILIFLIWWIPVSSIQQLDWKFPFQFTLQSLTSKGGNKAFVDRISGALEMSPSVISWLGISTLGIALLLGYLICKERNIQTKIFTISMFAFSVISWMVYNSITGSPFTFPKYWNIGLIGISLCLGLLSPNIKFGLKAKQKWGIIFLVGITFLTILTIIDFSVRSGLQLTRSISALNPNFKVIFIIAILIALATLLIQRMTREDVFSVLFVMIVVGVTAINSGVNSALSKVDFSTRYYFGEAGQKVVLEWLTKNTNSDTILFSAKDIGLESGLPFYEDAQILASVKTSDIPNYLRQNGINVIVIRNLYDYSPQVYPSQLEAAVRGFSQIPNSKFGDFQIWKRKSG